MKEKLLDIWHDLYYKLAPPSGERFAMTCKEAVTQMDLADPPATWGAWFRLKLHLSLCQACRFYFRSGRVLGQAIRQKVDSSGNAVDLEKLNQELLKKHARTRGQNDSQ